MMRLAEILKRFHGFTVMVPLEIPKALRQDCQDIRAINPKMEKQN